ncbi:MAG: YcxB family protein [bacterium]
MSDGANPYAPPTVAAAAPARVVAHTDATGAEARHIDVDITADDLAEFSAAHLVSSPSGRRQRRVFQVAFAFYVALMVSTALAKWWAERELDVGSIVTAVLVALFALFYAGFQRTMGRRITRRSLAASRNLGSVGPRRVTIAPRSFRCEGPYTDDQVRWPAVERIVESEHALYVYVSANSGYVVPRRAFASDAEFEAFVAMARQYQAAAQEN